MNLRILAQISDISSGSPGMDVGPIWKNEALVIRMGSFGCLTAPCAVKHPFVTFGWGTQAPLLALAPASGLSFGLGPRHISQPGPPGSREPELFSNGAIHIDAVRSPNLGLGFTLGGRPQGDKRPVGQLVRFLAWSWRSSGCLTA